MLRRFIRELHILRRAWLLFRERRAHPPRCASGWDSMLVAASAELLDDDDLSRTVMLPSGATYEGLTRTILDHARVPPDIDELINHLQLAFGISYADAVTAIDRALGGVVRAASGRADVSPDPERDPVAWHAYERCRSERHIIDDIYPGWILADGLESINDLLQEFRFICNQAEHTYSSPQSCGYPDLLPFGERILHLIRQHPDKRADFDRAFRDLWHREFSGPWELISFCMHHLQWASFREFMESVHSEAVSRRDWRCESVARHVLDSFKQEWNDLELFYANSDECGEA
jgi:hypothetical protein